MKFEHRARRNADIASAEIGCAGARAEAVDFDMAGRLRGGEVFADRAARVVSDGHAMTPMPAT